MRLRLGLSLLALSIAAAAAPLKIYTEPNPPFNYQEGGEIKGISTDAVRALVAKAGVDATIDILRWDAAYERAQRDKNACIYSTARVSNREKIFKWYGPIATNVWALYSLPSFDKKLAKAGDARFYKIGAVKNDAKVDFMRQEGASSILEAEKDSDNPVRLAKSNTDPAHIDLWITTQATAKDVAAKWGVKDLKEVLIVKKEDLYLACNPRTDKEILKRIDAAASN